MFVYTIEHYPKLRYNIYMHTQNNKGFSLIELLVVVAVFAFISIISTQTIATSLKGTRKADATQKVRDNIDAAVGVMERQLHKGKSIISTSGYPCTNTNLAGVDFIDANNNAVRFACIAGTDGSGNPISYIASNSAALTSTVDLYVKGCSFKCVSPAN